MIAFTLIVVVLIVVVLLRQNKTRKQRGLMGVVFSTVKQPPLPMEIDLRDSGRYVHRRGNVLY